MKNITLALDEATVEAGRKYAEQHHTTLNGLIRDLLSRLVSTDHHAVVAEMWGIMDAHSGHSGGKGWTRDDLHAR